ncbi:MAG: tetratricopeptide repeat protein [Gemmatimonadota bacterium]
MTSPAGRAGSLERMLEKRPDDARIRFALAVEYLNEGRTEDGIRELRAYLASSEDEGNAWGRLASALIDVGRTDEARDAYREGIAAAERYGHPTMAEEFSAELDGLGA